MDQPPAKRQRRLTVPESDESEFEKEERTPKVPRTRAPTRKAASKPKGDVTLKNATSKKPTTKPKARSNGLPARKTSQNSSKATTPASSPEKQRGKGTLDTDGAKSKSLLSFFGKASDQQRWDRRPGVGTPPGSGELDDDIEDDSLDEEELLKLPDPTQNHKTVLDRRKAIQSEPRHNGIGSRPDSITSASQKFMKPPVLRKASSGSSKPWTDEYAPANLSELGVHKKKVMDVQLWLEDVFSGRDRRSVLVLKGPAGSGKTATLALLSSSMGFEVKEWRNPDGAIVSNDGVSSMAAQFDDFLNRSGRFNSLDLMGSALETENNADTQDNKRRITLLEEFPNAFTQSSSSAQTFRSSVLRYLAANTLTQAALFDKSRKARRSPPLVMIISETLLTSSFASSDSFTAYRLLGPDISNHPGVCTIEFNAVAPTILSKALDLVLKKEARYSGRRRIPGPAVLKRLGESGDIRSAIGSLEFMCLRGDDGGDWGGRVAAKTKKSDGTALTSMERESLEMVTQRETTLGIFHAVGKVVYNKREAPKPTTEHCHPPDHLPDARRPNASEVDVEELIDETGTDTQTFIAALHENFLLSCDGSSFTDSFEGCIDALSQSDLLNLSSFRGLRSNAAGIGSGRATYQGTNIESLRQDEASFQVAVRGLLFALPSPVKRGYGSSTSGSINGRPIGRGDTFKMFYPASSRLWKQTEETEGLLTTWIDRNMINEGSASSTTSKKTTGVESWKSRNSTGLDPTSMDETPSLPAVRSSRMEILLERLPYMAQTCRQRQLPADLDRLTKFHGVDVPNDDSPEDEDDDQTTVPVPDTPSRRKAGRWMAATRNSRSAIPVESGVEKLVLSDDDIEDD